MKDDQATLPTAGGEDRNDPGFDSLLTRGKVVRDPVHKDIWITELEREIIDHWRFQRLKRIKQLGLTNFVFPGANHTRFEHSLGTLYLSQRIIGAINSNYESGLSNYQFDSEDVFITRIVALIHDMAHLPFGHTLEDQGKLFGEETQWEDSERREEILSDIFPIITRHMRSAGIDERMIENAKRYIKETIIAEEEGEKAIAKTERPYYADVVGNTICADLLDYIERDAYYTGIELSYDSQLFSHFVVDEYEPNQPRVGIVVEEDPEEFKRSIVTDSLDLLKARYALAEKVHQNQSKVKFSTMIIRAVYAALSSDDVDLEKQKLMKMGDDPLVEQLANVEPDDGQYYKQATKNIATKIIEREDYTSIFDMDALDGNHRVESFIDYPDERDKFIRRLENAIDARPGAVLVYSPEKRTGKAAQVKMVRQSEMKMLEELIDEFDNKFEYKKQEYTAIRDSYEKLWRFHIFLEEGYWDNWDDAQQEDIKRKLELACQDYLEKDTIHGLVELRRHFRDVKGHDVIDATDVGDVVREIRGLDDGSPIDRNVSHGFIDMVDDYLTDDDAG